MNILTKKEVQEKLGISRSGLELLVRNNGFPKPFYLGGKLSRWDAADVNRWLEERKQFYGDNHGSRNETESVCSSAA